MLEYIFFEESLLKRFTDYLAELGVEFQLDDMEVGVPEEIDEALVEAIEDKYQFLLQQNAELLESTDDALEKNLAAVMVQLSTGQSCNIKFAPDLLAKLLECISMEELRDLVQSVALAVENPSDKPVCMLP